MKTRSRLMLSVGGFVAALMFNAGSALAVSLDYTFTGQFFAGSFLNATLLDGKDFEVHILTDTTVPDSAPGEAQRGLFLGPFSAQITIEGMGVFSFVNPVSMITERTNGVGFQPVEARAAFGGGSTSSMTGFSPNLMAPFFGDPNLLDPFPGGANVVVADFNAEPLIALGSMDVLSLSGQSPGGTVKATTIPDSGSSLIMFGMAVTGLAGVAMRRRCFPVKA
jgi:hypothetical protein